MAISNQMKLRRAQVARTLAIRTRNPRAVVRRPAELPVRQPTAPRKECFRLTSSHRKKPEPLGKTVRGGRNACRKLCLMRGELEKLGVTR